MNLKNLFSLQTAITVLVVLVIYDLFAKDMIAKVFNYDDSFDAKENAPRKLISERELVKRLRQAA